MVAWVRTPHPHPEKINGGGGGGTGWWLQLAIHRDQIHEILGFSFRLMLCISVLFPASSFFSFLFFLFFWGGGGGAQPFASQGTKTPRCDLSEGEGWLMKLCYYCWREQTSCTLRQQLGTVTVCRPRIAACAQSHTPWGMSLVRLGGRWQGYKH